MEETIVRPLDMNAKTTGKENSSKNEELVKREPIKDTPFEVITLKNESFGAMGSYRVTEKYEKAKDVKTELKKMTWNRIVQVIMILNELSKNIETTKKDK